MDYNSDNSRDDTQDKGDSPKKIKIPLYKYSQDITLAESIILSNKPMFLQIVNKKPFLSERIEIDDYQIIEPVRVSDNLSKPYIFSSVEEIIQYIKRAEQETLDSLYTKVKEKWRLFFDIDEDSLNLCTADTIFTYFQDRLGMTHYLLFVGDNNTGKSNALRILHNIAYRPMFDVSITPANIYNFLGKVEEGQGIILEDEIDDIEKQLEKMKIYKPGYVSGSKVTRMYDTSIGKPKSQQSYYTYCFKAFSSESQPDIRKAKGFGERLFVVKCSPGNPKYDISEVMNDAGDPRYIKLFKQLEDLRKLLLIYRILHYNDVLSDIELSISRRDKQLCKPILRLFNNTKILDEITKSLSKFLWEKNSKKINSFDGFLYSVVSNLIRNGELMISNETLWKIIQTLPGNALQNKPHSFISDEFGLISKTSIAKICEDKFLARKNHNGRQRFLVFKKDVIEKLAGNYSEVKGIVIRNKLKNPNTVNTFTSFWNGIESNDSSKTKKENPLPGRENKTNQKAAVIDIDTSKDKEGDDSEWDEFYKASLSPPPKPLKPL